MRVSYHPEFSRIGIKTSDVQTMTLMDVVEKYVREGIYAIPAKASLGEDGTKIVHATMPHAKGGTAMRSGSDWNKSKARIKEYIQEREFNFLAIKTGVISDVFVLDVDVKDKPEEDILAGMPFWKRLIEKHGDPDTLKATTFSGGFHYYFSFSGTIRDGLQSGKNFVGLDVNGQLYGIDGRGEGGIAFAPPSSLGDGKEYRWNVPLKRTNIKSAPTWVIKLVNSSARRAGQTVHTSTQNAVQSILYSSLVEDGNMLLQPSVEKDGDSADDSLEIRDAQACEHKIAAAMMKLLKNAGLDENVSFSGKVSSRGPLGSFYSFICKGPRRCIHGHRHNGSNNFTLIKRGWVVLYRDFGVECSKKPLVELGNLSLTESLLDANPTKLHPTFDRSVFPDNCELLSEPERRYYVDLIKRNVMQRYRGLAAIFSAIYAIDGRILAEGKNFRYWNARSWLSDGSFHVQSVFSSRMSKLLKWYEHLRMEAFKQEVYKSAKGSEKWGCIPEGSEPGPLPEWATCPKREEEKEACRKAWKTVGATLPFPSKGDSTCQLPDLTRGSEVRVCLEYVLNTLQIQEELDSLMDLANPYLFACDNGVLDTTTGQLLAPHPAQLCSRASKVAFRGMPKSESRFAKFLLDCFNDDREVLDWYQLYLGYCMTADTSEQIFLVKQGEGSNGKTLTMIASFQIFGSYAIVMDKDVIIEAGGKRTAGSASSHLIALKGARLAESDESKEKSVLNEATIKELSGGGSITARELQGKQETFLVTHKAILNTNYKPVIENAASFSLVRRMALLPMSVTFKSAETVNPKKSREKPKDPTLEGYLKSDEGREDGLSWVAAGAKRYFDLKRANPNILVLEKRPKAMEDALKAYVNDNDIAKRFIEECCEFEELEHGAKATWHLAIGERLGDAFRAWAKEEEISSSLTAQAVKKRIVRYADGANHVVEDGRFTDKTVQDKGQFKGLSGIRLKADCITDTALG